MRRHNIFITLLSFAIILDSIDIQHVKASLIEDATLGTLQQQQDPSNNDIMDNIDDLEIDINNDPTVSPPKHQGHWGTKSTNAKNGNNNASVNGNANGSGNSNGHGEHIPFVPHHKNKGNDTVTHQQHQHAQHQQSYHQNQSIQYTPPDSFTITAKITSNSEFANTESSISTSTSSASASASSSAITSSLPSIPFMECNNIGTTTQSILNQASFRHFPKSGAHPTTYTKTNGMIIPLSAQVEIQVRGSSNGNSNGNGNGNGGNSNTVSANDNGSVNNNDKKSDVNNNNINNKEGEIRTFKRGDVIWVDGGEYKMTSAKGCDDDLSVLILNIDKKNNENKNIFRNNKYNPSNPTKISCSMMDFSYGTYSFLDEQDEVSLGMAFVQNIVKIPMRKVLLSSIGLSVSSLVTYFLSKVAPLQLAVGIGGACVISGGTYAVVSGGEWLCEEIEKIWDDSRSRKRRSEMGVIDEDEDDDNDDSLGNADLDSSENDTSDTTVEEIAIVVEESLTI